MQLPRAFGPYTLLRRLAVGGMAEVYVAKTQGLGGFEKQVALKLVHPHLSANEHFVRMLIDEAKVLVKLNHANIAQVLDLGRIGEDYYIAMEYVDGWNLHQVLAATRALGQAVPPELAAHVVAEVCGGLDHAHRKRDDDGRPLNLVHRDVSPQNILVSQSGEVKLVDFGIAKGTHRGEGTEVGVIKGKYNYMSPEQAWADPMDRRSDLFSAGVVLWEMIAGRMLHQEANVPRLIADVRNARVPSLSTLRPDMSPELAAIVARSTARDPGERYQSAADMGEALRDFIYRHAPAYSARRLSETVSAWMAARAAQPTSPKTRQRAMLDRTREEFPPQPPLQPPLVTRADAPALPGLGNTLVEGPRGRRLPPLPFDSIPPPTEKMAQPPADGARISSWPSPPLPSADPWPGPGPGTSSTTSGTVGAAQHGSDGGAGHSTIPPATMPPAAPDRMAAASFGRAPELPPEFDVEPTSRYRSAHLTVPADVEPVETTTRQFGATGTADVTAGHTSRERPLSRDAVRPPPSGVEAIPTVPPTAPVPDVEAARRMFRASSWAKRLLYAAAGATATMLMAMTAWQLWPGEPEPAVLEIVSEPPGATVTVDGVARERPTPVRIDDFEAGRDYELVVEKPGYTSWAGTYHAAPGVVQHIAVLKPEEAELFIATQPTGAALWVDGVRLGTSPLRVSDLDPGRKITVRASLEGYADVSRELEIQADELQPRLELILPKSR